MADTIRDILEENTWTTLDLDARSMSQIRRLQAQVRHMGIVKAEQAIKQLIIKKIGNGLSAPTIGLMDEIKKIVEEL